MEVLPPFSCDGQRVALIHKNPNRTKGKLRTHQHNNEFFLCKLNLVSCHYMYSRVWRPELTVEEYSKHLYEKGKATVQKEINKLKEKGKQYYTEARLRQIRFAKART